MTRKNEELTIAFDVDGRKYRTTKYNPDKSLRMMNKLSKLIGGPIGNALGAFGGADLTGSDLEILNSIKGDDLGAAIRTLLTGIEDEDLPTLIRYIIADTDISIDGPKGEIWVSIDLTRDFYGDRLFDVFEVCAKVINANYRGLVGKLKRSGEASGLLGVFKKLQADRGSKGKLSD